MAVLTRTTILMGLCLLGCGRAELPEGSAAVGLAGLAPPDGGANAGDCFLGWDTAVVAPVQDSRGAVAYLPVCGRSTCLPIVTSGHPEPAYSPPHSTCDELPASVQAACGTSPTCDCLAPLLRQGAVWPFTKWNCSWFCRAKADGTVGLLWCSLP